MYSSSCLPVVRQTRGAHRVEIANTGIAPTEATNITKQKRRGSLSLCFGKWINCGSVSMDITH
ncbi:hypothetical protein E2C01_066329 [Portunus trituberculatus]|uniref:Uncharacterized protein n=1 Tax=Portunus trituberculatus TaxID=210409 RepID=A0A5B7HPZ9_PORTR|nr:hypothetical protein [Portunus trituberculatus]